MLKRKTVIFLCTAVALALSGCASSSDSNGEISEETKREITDTDLIYNNIIINYINVGGLTKEQAKDVLNEEIQEPLKDAEISFISGKSGETVKECSYFDLGVRYDIDGIVEEAYNYGRTGTLEQKYETVRQLARQSKSIEYFDRFSYDEEKVNEIIDEIAEIVYKAPTEPKAKMEGGRAVITQSGEKGSELDKEKLKSMLEAILSDISYSREGDDIYLPMKDIETELSDADIAKIDSTLGTFSSRFSGSLSNGRNVNMKVAASKINGVIVMPGEVFSTNEHFGSSTADNGYVNAPVIVNGELEDGIGGGVCQVSSALYNAVLYAELEVVQRQNHSLKVGYADYGFDATLADNSIDFKFKNDTDAPIMVESYLANNRVYCTIYGHETRPASRTLKFENKLVSSSEESVRYEVYKLIYDNGVLQDKVKVNTSTYKLKTKKTEQNPAAEAQTEATTAASEAADRSASPEQPAQSASTAQTEPVQSQPAAQTTPAQAAPAAQNQPAQSTPAVQTAPVESNVPTQAEQPAQSTPASQSEPTQGTAPVSSQEVDVVPDEPVM